MSCEESPINYDIAITNVMVLDGSGSSAFEANVFVNADTIAKIDKILSHRYIATQEIDGNGRYLTPGFIDLHAHGDPTITPEFENFLAMGVTTISLGQDGSSPHVEDQAQWQKQVNESGVGVNLAMFVGHGTLRHLAGIGNDSTGTLSQQEKLESLLQYNLQHCFGMSTGLEYTPGMYAKEAELISLAKIVGKSKRMIMSHVRNEDDDQLEQSINELVRQGEYARVHVAHMKSVYGKGSGRALSLLDQIISAREAGINITADVYPYIASYTGIGIVFPEWCKTEEQYQKYRQTRWGQLTEFIRNKVHQRNGPEATLLGTEPYTGKTLADLQTEMNKPFEQILVDDIGPRGASGAYFVMNDELQSTLIADPIVSICSDGSPTGFHPRGHGTFAKIIEEYVLKRNALTLPEAIRKMTSYAAEILQIEKRGIIEIGAFADLILFDPNRVKAKATYPEPHQLAEGFDLVMVNGKIARQDHSTQAVLAGRVLVPSKN